MVLISINPASAEKEGSAWCSFMGRCNRIAVGAGAALALALRLGSGQEGEVERRIESERGRERERGREDVCSRQTQVF